MTDTQTRLDRYEEARTRDEITGSPAARVALAAAKADLEAHGEWADVGSS